YSPPWVLNPLHRDGRHKARVFDSALSGSRGTTPTSWRERYSPLRRTLTTPRRGGARSPPAFSLDDAERVIAAAPALAGARRPALDAHIWRGPGGERARHAAVYRSGQLDRAPAAGRGRAGTAHLSGPPPPAQGHRRGARRPGGEVAGRRADDRVLLGCPRRARCRGRAAGGAPGRARGA